MAKTTFNVELTIRHDDELDAPQKAEDYLSDALQQMLNAFEDIVDFQLEKVRTW
jgi:hypothetical protein